MLHSKDAQRVFTLKFEHLYQQNGQTFRNLKQFIILSYPDASKMWELTTEKLHDRGLFGESQETLDIVQLKDNLVIQATHSSKADTIKILKFDFESNEFVTQSESKPFDVPIKCLFGESAYTTFVLT